MCAYLALATSELYVLDSGFEVYTHADVYIMHVMYTATTVGLVFIWCVTLENIPYHIWSTHKSSHASGGLTESIQEEDWQWSSSEVQRTI